MDVGGPAPCTHQVMRAATLTVLLLVLIEGGMAAKKKRRKTSDPSPLPSGADALAMSSHQRGTMAHVQGDIKGAMRLFREAIAHKPDFAYAYYRLGFVMHEQRQLRPERAHEDPVPIFRCAHTRSAQAGGDSSPCVCICQPTGPAHRAALALDPSDEMVHYALGQALQDSDQHSEAASVYEGITTSVNPRSAQAYWALGKVRAKGVDEWDSDPDDPNDPSHCYEQASRLQPGEFMPDGTRVRRLEPMTAEREAREAREARERREKVLDDLREGRQTLKYAAEPPV